MPFIPVCRSEEVSEGDSRMVKVGDQMLALHRVNGELFATDNECPHAGASLAHGELDGCVVSCRIHHWRFNVETGQYLDEDNPRHNLRTYPVRCVEGIVEVSLNQTST